MRLSKIRVLVMALIEKEVDKEVRNVKDLR